MNTTETFKCVPYGARQEIPQGRPTSLFGRVLKCWQKYSDWRIQNKKRIWRNMRESLPGPGKTAQRMHESYCH